MIWPSTAAACAVLLLALGVTSCSKWEVEQTSPASFLVSDPPGAIRVERHDGSVVELVQPKVHENELSGLVPGSAAPGAPFRRVLIPLADIRRVASRRSDTKRTLGAVISAPLIYFAGSYLMQW
jgi:hypothetical protein